MCACGCVDNWWVWFLGQNQKQPVGWWVCLEVAL